MKRFITLLFIVSLVASSAMAQEKVRRTVVVKDGKVVQDDFDSGDFTLFAGPRAFLGVTLTDVTSELREHFGAPKGAGVLVGAVESGSPADKAGMRVGDLILGIEGKDVASSWDIRAALKEKKDGDTARVEVLRNGSRQTMVATLIEREPRVRFGEMGEIDKKIGEALGNREWRAHVTHLGDCGELQTRIKDLETRLKDLEKKLQK